MASAIVHFEIHVSDIEQASKFYTEVFDWRIEQWGDAPYWVIYTGRSQYPDGSAIGMDGGMLKRVSEEPVGKAEANAFVCTIEVEDIETMTQKIVSAGGKVAVPKKAIGDMGWQAFCKDPDGNIFGLMQNKPTE